MKVWGSHTCVQKCRQGNVGKPQGGGVIGSVTPEEWPSDNPADGERVQ